MRRWLPALAVLLLAACAGTQKKPGPPATAGASSAAPTVAGTPPDCTGFVPYPAAQEDPSTRGDYVAGGLYKPGVNDSTPDYLPRVDCIREPDVVALPRSAYGNRSPYKVLGRSYEVLGATDGYVETGLASYYGNKFHGRRTSNHEVYDMYAFTAAHKSLPLPSFARVTNLENGRSVVVRVNDRGPFHDGRVVDLSYAAAVKLDIHRRGTGRVEVRALQPGEVLAKASQRPQAAPAAAPAATSGMDSLVDALPRASAAPVMLAAATSSSAGAPASYARAADHPGYGRESDRFRMVDENGRIRTADEFDAWLRERQARLQAEQAAAAAAAPASVAAGAPPATASAVPAARAPQASAAQAASAGVTLQVGVFSVRGNADRALSTLRGAGIPGARVLDFASAGRTLYRVRVGPVEAASVKELVPRLTGLGFELPQVVRE